MSFVGEPNGLGMRVQTTQGPQSDNGIKNPSDKTYGVKAGSFCHS